MKYSTLRLLLLIAGTLVLLLSVGSLWNDMWWSAGVGEFAVALRDTPSGSPQPGGLTNAEIAKELLDLVQQRGPRSFYLQGACALIGFGIALVAVFAREKNGRAALVGSTVATPPR